MGDFFFGIQAWFCLPQLIRSLVWLKDVVFRRLSMLPTTVLALVAALLHQTTAAFLLLWQGDRVVECGLETVAETKDGNCAVSKISELK